MIAVPSDYDDVRVLTLKGKLVANEDVVKLQEAVNAEYDRDVKKLIINLKNINWISSIGIGGLMRCLTRSKNKNVSLRFAGVNDKVQNIFSIMKLDSVLDIFPDINSALASF